MPKPVKFTPTLLPSRKRKPSRWLLQQVVIDEALDSDGVADRKFLDTLERIDTSPWWSVDQITPLFHGPDFLQRLLHQISQAESEVLLESYIFHADHSGQQLANALIGAAARGLSVRVLVDAWGSNETEPTFWQQLRAGGVELKRFKPPHLGFLYPIVRDHRKICVIDRKVAYLGGMNIGDEYLRQSTSLWRDTQVEIHGAVCAELTVVFNECWTQAGGAPLTLPSAQTYPSDPNKAQLLVQDSQPGRGLLEATLGFVATCHAVRERLWITNAYFAPKRVVIKSLLAAVQRGVDVRLLFPAKSDIPVLKWAARSVYADLLKGGARVFEYQPRVLHAKSLLADQTLSVIGSQNLDARSYQFNAECNVVIDAQPVNELMAEQFLADLNQAKEIKLAAWQRRSIGWRIRSAIARIIAPLL